MRNARNQAIIFPAFFFSVEKYFVLNQSDLCFPNRMEKVEFSQK